MIHQCTTQSQVENAQYDTYQYENIKPVREGDNTHP